jgi:hypothetical protein
VLRFARWLRGQRTVELAPLALTLSVASVFIPIAIFDGSVAAQASVPPQAPVALAPAPGQLIPTNLWRSKPLAAVAAAAKAAKRAGPLPKAFVPSMTGLEQENATGGDIIPAGCEPFRSRAIGKVCRLGDISSTRVIVALGDSQAGTWMSALVAVGLEQHFAVVPLDKPGCFVTLVYVNSPGKPCATWYRWALAQDKALHPVATITVFLLPTRFQRHPALAVKNMRSVLSQVTNAVLIPDQPAQEQKAPACLFRAGANMGKCSVRVPSTYVPLLRALARMTTLTHHPAIPTLQWFCADGICPMVIDHILTVRDKDHMTTEYSTALAPLLSLELKPILSRRPAA